MAVAALVIVGAVFSTSSVTETVMSCTSVKPAESVTVTWNSKSLSPLASDGASKSGAALKVTTPLSASMENSAASAPPVKL